MAKSRYTYGSAAERLDNDVYIQPQYDNNNEKNRKKTAKIEQNREKALSMNLSYVILLCIAVVATLFVCVQYLRVQSSIAANIKKIEIKEQEIAILNIENEALIANIEAHVNFDAIYKVATEELGMVYPNEEQIILYDRVENGYVRRNAEISVE
jgi:Septum formation initiator.